MKRGLFILTSIIFLILSGCANLTGVDPSSLDKTNKTNYVVVQNEYKWETKFSFAQITHFMTLKAGIYYPYLDDSSGTYYEGKGLCLEWKVAATSGEGAPTTNNYRCGLYISNDNSKRSIVYYYIDVEASKRTMMQTKPGLLIEALDRTEWDNLKHLLYQPDAAELMSHIEVVN